MPIADDTFACLAIAVGLAALYALVSLARWAGRRRERRTRRDDVMAIYDAVKDVREDRDK